MCRSPECRTPDLADLYADALTTLSVATRRPAIVAELADSRAVRVEFEYNRYLLATAVDRGPMDSVAWTRWQVRFHQRSVDGPDPVLSEATSTWLIDAYDAAVADLPAATLHVSDYTAPD